MEKQPTVLLVEDDENDILFFEKALETDGLHFELQVARDGQEAQDYMTGEGKFTNRELFRFPKFIITDNKMPRTTGSTFLKWLKDHPRFHVVPTIVFSGSGKPSDVRAAYDTLGIHSYILKPHGAKELAESVALIFKYWAMCVLPPTIQENEEGDGPRAVSAPEQPPRLAPIA